MRQNRAVSKSAPPTDGLDEKARVGWVLGWVWMAFAALNVIDILRHEWSRSSAHAGSVLLLVSGIVWVIALRPRLRADADRVLLRNPLRDIEIPWGAVTEIESRDTVRVTTEDRRYHSWVGHVPHRRRAWFSRSRMPGRAAGLGVGLGGKGRTEPTAAEAAPSATEAEDLVQRLTDMADRFRRDSADAGRTEETVRWSWISVAALAAPVLLFAVTVLVT